MTVKQVLEILQNEVEISGCDDMPVVIMNSHQHGDPITNDVREVNRVQRWMDQYNDNRKTILLF